MYNDLMSPDEYEEEVNEIRNIRLDKNLLESHDWYLSLTTRNSSEVTFIRRRLTPRLWIFVSAIPKDSNCSILQSYIHNGKTSLEVLSKAKGILCEFSQVEFLRSHEKGIRIKRKFPFLFSIVQKDIGDTDSREIHF